MIIANRGVDLKIPNTDRFQLLSILWLLLFVTLLILLVILNEPLRRAALHLRPMLQAIIFAISFCGLGAPFASRLLKEVDRTIEVLVAFAFGIGLNSLFVFTLGLTFSFHPVLLSVWCILGIILAIVHFRSWLSGLRFPRLNSGWDTFGIVVISLSLLTILPLVVSPEVSTDALTYHLLVPREYLSLGRISAIPLFLESNYPQLAELNYLLILRLTDEISCKCFHFLVGLSVLIAIGRIVEKLSNQSGPYLGPALFLSMPVVMLQLGWAWNDFFLTLFIVLGLYFFLNYSENDLPNPQRRNLVLAGLMAGFAAWTKYTAVIFFASMSIVVLICVLVWKRKAREFLYFVLPLLVLSLPLLIKNSIFTGNPFFPFLNNIFHSTFWSASLNDYFEKAVRRYYISDWDWSTYILFPFLLSLKPRVADIHTGVLPWVLFPLLFLAGGSRKILLLKTYAVCCLGAWFLIQSGVRTVFSLFAVTFILSSLVLQEKENFSAENMKRGIVFLFAIAISLNLLLTVVNIDHFFSPVRFFIGQENKNQYLTRLSPHQHVFDFLNGQKNVGKVLLVSLHGPLYLKQPYLFSGRYDFPIAQVLGFEFTKPELLAERLRNLGISHIAIDHQKYEEENRQGLYSWDSANKQVFEKVMTAHCRIAFRSGKEFVLEWK